MINKNDKKRKKTKISAFRWQLGHRSLPQLTLALRLFKKNSFLLRINFKQISRKSDQSWVKIVRGCFDVEEDMAKGKYVKDHDL